MSFSRRSNESSIPAFFCCGQPVAVRMPPLMIELPPAVGIFSRTTTLAPAFLASMAAAKPAKPEPMTITSTVSSHFVAGAAETTELAKEAAPAATAPVSMLRREIRSIIGNLSFFGLGGESVLAREQGRLST